MIIITGANQNNLKNLDLNLPLNSITVVTGVSGSGKSSLAFDTVYAEGQRRYIESFSTYARQFMDRMDKPEVKNIQGILPSIAINQTNTVKTSRSTLGTLTEINDYVKLLFPRLATLHCRTCNKPVEKDTPDSIAEKLLEQCPAERCVLTFPLQIPESSNISIAEIETGLRGQGFFRVYHQDAFSELSPELIEAHRGDSIVLLADRLAVTPENRKRMIDSLESAMKFGKGQVSIFFPDSPQRILKFSSALHCPQCDITYTKPCPNLFSFNSPLGACETCNGFGKTIEVDLDAAIPDHSLSLKNDAVKPWSTPAYRDAYREMLSFCKQNGIPVDKPFEQLNKAEQDAVIYGTDGFFGIMGFFDWLETKTYKMHIRVLLSKYRAYRTCTSCQGTRFKPDSLLFRINGTTITDFYDMNITAADRFMAGIQKNAGGDETVDVLLGEITGRLSYLERVGLGYLSLDRQSRTLSGGEVERASLTTALGSSLVNTLYVLDEPSIGLHPRDTSRLIDILQGLRDLGNTILVVEHDPDIIMQSDRVIDLGPGSGAQGGQIVFSGSPQQMLTDSASLTGQYLSGRLSIPLPRSKRTGDPHSHITITNADKHNLKDLNLTIPLGLLVCITGVSGSGKSTLLEDILYDQLSGKPGRNTTCRLGGMHAPDHVLLMDQSPVGKTPRSNPVTYIKAFGTIRQLFAQAELAQERGYTASTFSFNSSGGRCEHCQGDGYEKIEMQFLADIYVTCSSCQGTRYSPEVLDITYQDCNINDVLDMTITEAGQFFKDIPKIEYPLRLLQMVGLGYLQLGQAANTLSGGESQRLKIAAFIQQGSSRKTLFLFDEPTTGLHFDDIKNLLQTFDFLLKQGHSIVVVEHNLEVIKCADHLVDMGPEGGDLGGTVVFTGTPEAIIEHPASYTGAYLKQYLKPSGTTHPMPERPAAPAPENDTIVIEGAREHNLKNISLAIPREKMVVITGLSGSGKSTLAFDILFAEGQRRFLETLSPYARQYIHQLSRPAVDALRGLPPTVAIEQFLSHGGRKSTVATATEIYHYLRLLYAKAGNQVCPQCGEPMTPQSPLDIAEALINAYDSRLIIMLAPQIRGRKGTHKDTIQKARKGGFEKIRIDGTIVRVKNLFAIGRYHEHEIEIVTAEFTPSALSPARIHEEINRALGLGKGELIVLAEDGTETFFSTKACCPTCRISLEEPDPRLFSFNSRHGACATCSGLGISNILAPDLLIADTTKTINEGALAPLADKALPPATRKNIREQITAAGIDLDTPIKKLTKAKRKTLFYGKKAFPGLLKMLESQPLKRKAGLEDYISQFYRETPCPDCEGTRLNDHARAVRINGKSITDLTKMTSGQLRSFLTGINFTRKQQIIATPILEELLPKLGLLEKAGLSYLSLDRSADTLSGGEAQRIRLAAQVASNLRGVAYVLDEPTIGLHPRDNQNLIGIMRELQQKGNSVIIVEHDEETIRHADYIIDLGTGGGTHGGNIVAAGTVSSIMATPGSITGAYLAGNKPGRAAASARSLKRCPAIKITGACAHNLHNITARFPVGRLTVVCGVSGSGKTTLVRDTLYKGMKKILGTYHGCLGAHRNLTGTEYCKRVVEIDQSPIGKTPRSVPATYVGFYDEIRKIFSMVPEAKIRGYSPARFSFNLSGGRCEKCLGQGKIKVAMSFLPDMLVDCDECGGSRFNEETLRVLFKGHTIAQVLAMTVEEACEFFTGIPTIHKPLNILNDMGLGYLSLGQQSPTLSGGEAQRIKIAAELCKSSHGKTLYILDEPTTGLHSADIEKLMVILQSLVDLGNTLIIIEHNMAVISQADNLIDLGPGGGDEGGTIVAEGPPRVVAFNSDTTSETARYLKKYFEKKSPEYGVRSPGC